MRQEPDHRRLVRVVSRASALEHVAPVVAHVSDVDAGLVGKLSLHGCVPRIHRRGDELVWPHVGLHVERLACASRSSGAGSKQGKNPVGGNYRELVGVGPTVKLKAGVLLSLVGPLMV